jgi:NitT/TauT family transport system ATP-binding protein
LKAREVVLDVQHLSKVFVSGKRSTNALNDINSQTHRREFLCVVGPSGCSKSTFLRILAGLEQASAGQSAAGQGGQRSRHPRVTRYFPGSPSRRT